MTGRQWMLVAGLVVGVGLHLLAGDDAAMPAVVAPVEKPARSTAAAPALPAVPGASPSRASTGGTPAAGERPAREVDLRLLGAIDSNAAFREHSWYTPPPPPKVVAPPVPATPVAPPAPVAPPLPWVFSGRMESDEGTTVYLTAGERLVSARPGVTLDRVWQLERVDAAALHFRYLPLNTTHSLPAGR